MFSKIKNILTYYDSEPNEIMQSLIWILIFPMICIFEDKFKCYFFIPSLIIGAFSLRTICYGTLEQRKNISLIVFLFSVSVLCYYLMTKGIYQNSVNILWIAVTVNAFFNLTTLTKHYQLSN